MPRILAGDTLMKPHSNDRMRLHFLGWQCRLRQHCMRHEGGRPASGMRPRVLTSDGETISDGIVTLLVPREPAEHLAFFRFQVLRTNDPRQRYEKGLEYLQSTYFQVPDDFGDEMMAVFAADSPVAKRMLATGEVLLEFEQFNQTYRMTCAVRRLPARDPRRELTLWHNRLFNPDLPATALVIGLQPLWRSAQAHPEP